MTFDKASRRLLDLAYDRLDAAQAAEPKDDVLIANALAEVRRLETLDADLMHATAISAGAFDAEKVARLMSEARALLGTLSED